MTTDSIFRASKKITKDGFGSCVVYYMKPNTVEQKHFHDCTEVLYIVKGSCKTHTQGNVYLYKKGQVHQVINDSNEELVFVCLTIPPETEKNTHYV
ncbi:MAG: cupin domain-containing protein [Candidatus Roizmanbacteria bacterium]|nr:cupin domain-containing protein [Candidatus Roizmanbacteria bacterium]